MLSRLVLLSTLLLCVIAVPEVKVGNTKVVGRSINSLHQEFFGGIPYAEPPVGHLRLHNPKPKTLSGLSFDATQYGKGCLQVQGIPTQESEDCLTINVLRPAGVNETAKLPVYFYTYGGGYYNGNSSAYNASAIVGKSIQRGTPIIYVNFNYRLGPLGFPQGYEAATSGVLNLGLKDQLLALKWVQQNIKCFGGDNTKVTVGGDTSGSIMNSIQMLNPDFAKVARAAILQSGGPAPVPELFPSEKQPYWQNFTASVSSCSSVAVSNNTLACLRKANASEIASAYPGAVQAAGGVFGFNPSIDGQFIPELPSKILASGNYAQIPFIAGTNLDEGTLFTPTTGPFDDAILREFFVMRIPPIVDAAIVNATITKILQLYPDDPALGSPFGTGNETFGLPTGYKRVAAFQGDISFQSQRRFLSQTASCAGIKTWSYIFTQPTPSTPPILGVYHTSEIPYVYGQPSGNSASGLALSNIIVDYWLSFVTSLDPNDGQGENRPQWPQYETQNKVILQLKSNATQVIPDNYRQEQVEFINSNPGAFRH
ncbi:triacylglycerol lipase 3 [Crepidotus variabilis]|uniref:Triacylglycerol lipase 3 n=1 Tax=Crepidotus variabilis TaxID=179855 RepID=A0A9P6JSN4_9AGAR|nr:triacylglycerol lipase 3 [Crepidotus variabilis]